LRSPPHDQVLGLHCSSLEYPAEVRTSHKDIKASERETTNQHESSILSVSMTQLMSENAAKSAYFGTAPSLLAASQGVIIPKWFAHNGTNTIWPRTSKELWHRDCLFVVVRRILAPPKFSHQTSLKCIKSVKHHSSLLLK